MTARVWQANPSLPHPSRAFVSKLKLYQLAAALKGTIQAALASQNDHASRKTALVSDATKKTFFEHFSCSGIKTTFTPRYRTVGMNLEDPHINEGLRIHLDAIGKMKKLADSHSIQFLVVLLPTKELVFNDIYCQSVSKPSESVQTTVRHNNEIRARTQEYLNRLNIASIDALPILVACLERHQQPFFENADGHLNAVGHEAIANAVFEYMNNCNLKQ
jgi:hypothetical protein